MICVLYVNDIQLGHHITQCAYIYIGQYITVLLNIIIESAGPGHNIYNIIRGLFIDPEHSHHVLFDV